MIISSWNVNSIKVRLPNVLQYLAEYEPDILVLQETKSIDLNFPEDEIQSCGYHSYYCGQKTYNGVAILSKGKCLDVELNPVAIDEAEVEQSRALMIIFVYLTYMLLTANLLVLTSININ